MRKRASYEVVETPPNNTTTWDMIGLLDKIIGDLELKLIGITRGIDFIMYGFEAKRDIRETILKLRKRLKKEKIRFEILDGYEIVLIAIPTKPEKDRVFWIDIWIEGIVHSFTIRPPENIAARV